MDLTPFWELLCDPAVEKIAHAAQQDIEPVVRHLGCAPANLFDTQIAAGFAALPYPVALSKLVLEFTGVRLGKGLTFTHWDQRPLSPSQLRYAADDVRYLPLIRRRNRQAAGRARPRRVGAGGMRRPVRPGPLPVRPGDAIPPRPRRRLARPAQPGGPAGAVRLA